MTRTRPLLADSRILQCLRPAGGWLFVLMVQTLALPTVWAFSPGPQGREIQLEPSTTSFEYQLPDALIESTGQQKQRCSNFEPLECIGDGRLTQHPALARPAATAARPRSIAHPLSLSRSARPPPRSLPNRKLN